MKTGDKAVILYNPFHKGAEQTRELANERDIRVRPPRGYFQEVAGLSKPKRNNGILVPGTILTRDYKGQKIYVEVLSNGYRYNKLRYKSLSAVAREVTGIHWNGRLFFGVRKAG
jgi:hypothetical protein